MHARSTTTEPWTLATEPQHYLGIVTAMKIRESMRNYTLSLNQETVASGLPMVRPMVLAFPNDVQCAGEDVEDQWMFGPTYLVGPVLSFQALNRSVYLPKLDTGRWVSFFSGEDLGGGGGRITVDTRNITEFPLFVRTTSPLTP